LRSRRNDGVKPACRWEPSSRSISANPVYERQRESAGNKISPMSDLIGDSVGEELNLLWLRAAKPAPHQGRVEQARGGLGHGPTGSRSCG